MRNGLPASTCSLLKQEEIRFTEQRPFLEVSVGATVASVRANACAH